MEKTVRQLKRELKAGRDLEQNLPVFMNRMASVYGQLSLYNLAMELSMFVESKTEERIKPDEAFRKLEETVHSIMEETLLREGEHGFDPEKNKAEVAALAALRGHIKEWMETLTTYTDLFNLYEYMLNRMEPKFEEKPELDTGDEQIAEEVLRWIFSDDENALVNERIREMLFCLPVRMTKGKLADRIEYAFALYKEADRSSIDLFDYMLRSASGLLPMSEERKGQFPQLEEIRVSLEEMASSDPTEEQYEEWKKQLEAGVDIIYNLTECYDAIQAIVNELLTVLLTRPYFTPEAEKDSEEAIGMIKQIFAERNVDAEALFTGIENKMEKLSDDVMMLEPLLEIISEEMSGKISELLLTAVHQRLLAAQRLNSGSMYAELLPEEEKELPEGYLEQVKTRFLEEVQNTLANGSKRRNRAVMAAILRELPLLFQSSAEVMDYVRNSLNGCHDEGEKRVSVELLRSCYVEG